jgi:hypothetical protein
VSPEDVAQPRGPFSVRVCAGCGQQINDGHHGHGGKLAPVYEVPAVLISEVDAWLDEEPLSAPHAAGGMVLGPHGRLRALRYRLSDELGDLRLRLAVAEGTLRRIARRRPNQQAADAAFYRSRRDAREALRESERAA